MISQAEYGNRAADPAFGMIVLIDKCLAAIPRSSPQANAVNPATNSSGFTPTIATFTNQHRPQDCPQILCAMTCRGIVSVEAQRGLRQAQT
jgi:hypothetical protein